MSFEGEVKGFDDQRDSAELKFTRKHVFSTRNNILSGITLSAWFRILWFYGQYIEVIYYPRALFVTLLATISSVLAYIENIYYPDTLLDEIELPSDPVFIIGHPRTGTTLMHNLLASDKENFFYCDTFAAGFPSSFLWFEKYGRSMFGGLLDKTRPMDSMPLHFDLPGEDELATNVLSGGCSYYMPLIFMKQEYKFRKYLDFNSELGSTDDDEKAWTTSFVYLIKKLMYKEMIKILQIGEEDYS